MIDESRRDWKVTAITIIFKCQKHIFYDIRLEMKFINIKFIQISLVQMFAHNVALNLFRTYFVCKLL